MCAAAASTCASTSAHSSFSSLIEHEGLVPIIYREEYNIGFWNLEKLHPFDSKKYGKIYRKLVDNNVISPQEVYKPALPSTEQLLMLHPQSYLDSLNSSMRVAGMLEVGIVAMLPSFVIREHVLVPMQYATAGSMLGGTLAVKQKQQQQEHTAASRTGTLYWAVNLSGGYHHASSAAGGGFCIYDDISLTILHVHSVYPACTRFMIVDLDAHQGNGHERDKLNKVYPPQLSVYTLDMYNAHIYPYDVTARQMIDCDIPLLPNTDTATYLHKLHTHLTQALSAFTPDLCIYNAGTDCLSGDPLGALDLSRAGIIQRDEYVFQSMKDRGIPVVMLLSGGYQQINGEIIGESLLNLHQKFGLFEKTSKHTRTAPPPQHTHAANTDSKAREE